MHPSQRFAAPHSILPGVPLKELINTRHVALIAEAFSQVDTNFDVQTFARKAADGLDTLELKDRARHIAQALDEQLPVETSAACSMVVESFGPKLRATCDFGLAPFYYLPLTEWIGLFAVGDLESGLQACYEATQRSTAEYCIRPFILRYESRVLEALSSWCKDTNPHVRRLVSEGTRPRLPWAMRLKSMQANPERSLPLLEQLKDDDDLYVRRSVANHLGDIAKDHLNLVLETCRTWLEESYRMADEPRAKNRRWIIRHALRYPAKKGDAGALALRVDAR